MTSDDLKIQNKFREAIQYSLQPPEGSNFLIINRSADDLSSLAENAAKELGLKVSKFDLCFQGHYDTFPSELKKEIASGKYPRAIGFFCYPEDKDWGQKETPARVDLIYDVIKKTPIGYMHAPGIDRDMALNGAVQCDYRQMVKKSEKMLKLLNGVKKLHINAPAGTALDVEMPSEVIFETDCVAVPPDTYGNPGKMHNLPVGEVCALRRKKVSIAGKEVEYPVKLIGNGKIVCDVCADHIEKLVEPDKPIKIVLKDGIVTYFHSDDEAFKPVSDEWMKREIEYGLPTVLEEVGIGINDKARRSKKLLETEKLAGTVHFAPAHIRSHADFIVDKPTVTITYGDKTERILMEDGVLKLD
jgi:hypothetical protein